MIHCRIIGLTCEGVGYLIRFRIISHFSAAAGAPPCHNQMTLSLSTGATNDPRPEGNRPWHASSTYSRHRSCHSADQCLCAAEYDLGAAERGRGPGDRDRCESAVSDFQGIPVHKSHEGKSCQTRYEDAGGCRKVSRTRQVLSRLQAALTRIFPRADAPPVTRWDLVATAAGSHPRSHCRSRSRSFRNQIELDPRLRPADSGQGSALLHPPDGRFMSYRHHAESDPCAPSAIKRCCPSTHRLRWLISSWPNPSRAAGTC